MSRRSSLLLSLCAALCACTKAEPEADSTQSSTASSSTGSGTETSGTETGSTETGSTETGGEDPQPAWLATWAASPQDANPISALPIELEDQTLRQRAHLSLGGEQVRLRLSNTFGDEDVFVREAYVGLSAQGPELQPDSEQRLHVEDQGEFRIPAGETITTDPVALAVPSLGDLSVSLYFQQLATSETLHAAAHQTAWWLAGNLSAAPSWAQQELMTSSSAYWLSGVEVLAPPEARAIVAFGDSITEGSGSTIDANSRWPDLLAARLQASPDHAQISVVNAGIGGNCLLRLFIGERGLDRFERDVLEQPGVAWVIITIGINDIGLDAGFGQTLTVEQLIAGHQQLIDSAHDHGLVAIGGTLLPFEDAYYYSEGGEALRQAFNAWVRTSGAYDAVLDFDAATRDPNAPTRLLPTYDSGDHLHPSDAGYAAMAEAIDLSLF